MQDGTRLVLTMQQIRAVYHGQFGVFQADCFGLSDEAMAALFLNAFSYYGEALAFANRHSPAAAIHLIGRPQPPPSSKRDHTLFPAASELKGVCDEKRG